MCQLHSPPTSASASKTNKGKRNNFASEGLLLLSDTRRKQAAGEATSAPQKDSPGIVGSGNGGDSAGNWSLDPDKEAKDASGSI